MVTAAALGSGTHHGCSVLEAPSWSLKANAVGSLNGLIAKLFTHYYCMKRWWLGLRKRGWWVVTTAQASSYRSHKIENPSNWRQSQLQEVLGRLRICQPHPEAHGQEGREAGRCAAVTSPRIQWPRSCTVVMQEWARQSFLIRAKGVRSPLPAGSQALQQLGSGNYHGRCL